MQRPVFMYCRRTLRSGTDAVENRKEDSSAETQKCVGKENIEKDHLLKPPPSSATIR
jgi:hypothetical protein